MKKILVLSLLFAYILISPFYAQKITIDDADPGCKIIGVWADNVSNGYSSGGTLNNKFLYTSRYAPFKKTGKEQVIWTPNIKKAGKYKVEVSFRGTGNRSSRVSYKVKYDGGSKKMKINQRTSGMTWKKLGEFPFQTGRNGSVTLTSDGGSSAAADGTRFTFIGALSGITSSTSGSQPGNTSLTNLINAGNNKKVSATLDSGNTGTLEYICTTGGVVKVTPYLETYGNASLNVIITKNNGTKINWLDWSRSGDNDGSLLNVNGNSIASSMSNPTGSDWSPAVPVDYTYNLSKGDKVSISLTGSFGNANPSLKAVVVEPNPGSFTTPGGSGVNPGTGNTGVSGNTGSGNTGGSGSYSTIVYDSSTDSLKSKGATISNGVGTTNGGDTYLYVPGSYVSKLKGSQFRIELDWECHFKHHLGYFSIGIFFEEGIHIYGWGRNFVLRAAPRGTKLTAVVGTMNSNTPMNNHFLKMNKFPSKRHTLYIDGSDKRIKIHDGKTTYGEVTLSRSLSLPGKDLQIGWGLVDRKKGYGSKVKVWQVRLLKK